MKLASPDGIADLVEAWSQDSGLLIDDLDHKQLGRLLNAVAPLFDGCLLYPPDHYKREVLSVYDVAVQLAAEVIERGPL